jgi:hypothetical protein
MHGMLIQQQQQQQQHSLLSQASWGNAWYANMLLKFLVEDLIHIYPIYQAPSHRLL